MTVPECVNPSDQGSPDAGSGRSHGARGKDRASKPKSWWERTSVTLCVAAGMAVVGLGFVHVIIGVTSPYGLPFDFVLRESFGYREAVVDARRIESLPYTAARFKHPLSVAALRRRGYIPDDPGFEARMMARQREHLSQWQREFEASLGQPPVCWLDQLRGQEPAAGTDPEDAGTCNHRGIACARQGEYQAALAEFARAIRRDPTFADAFYNRAMVSIEIGNVGQAASDFGTVIEIRPSFIEGRTRRGRLYLAMNEHDKAIAEFTKAVEIDPQCAEALFHRSLAHYTKGDLEKATADAQAVQGLGLSIPVEFLRTLRGESRTGRVRISSPVDE